MRTPRGTAAVLELAAVQTPYIFARPIPGGAPNSAVPLGEGHHPVFLYLVARHGARWPTKKRMAQFQSLEELFKARCLRAGVPVTPPAVLHDEQYSTFIEV